MELDPRQTLIVAILVLYLGSYLNGRLAVLRNYNIPEPVTGGLLASLAFGLLYAFADIEVNFDMANRDMLLVVFFTTIGLSSRIDVLKEGGKSLLVLLVLAAGYLLVQNLVGIVRNEDEMRQAVSGIVELRRRAEEVGVVGNREYNPGWHTALDLENLLTVAEAIARSGLERRESRGAHFREDFPDKSEEFARVNTAIRRGADGEIEVRRDPVPELTEEQRRIVEEMR